MTALRLGFALEYSLGHATHADNLKRVLASDPASRDKESGIRPIYIDLRYDETPTNRWAKLPGIRSNWSLRASLGAYLALRPMVRSRCLDAVLFHTQVTSLLSVGLMHEGLPSVVSLDATPIQIDSLGGAYSHAVSTRPIERLKRRLNARSFHAARRLIAWSSWAADSLVHDYGVDRSRIAVIPPGVDIAAWDFTERPRAEYPGGGNVVHLLFVGGDFPRKGGNVLLEALRELSASSRSGLRHRLRLSIVTRSDIAALAEHVERETGISISIHRGLTPNADALRQLYADADLFVFPTQGDCLPLAVIEAMAAGLPVITTDVGALPEAVKEGENGLIVPPGDPAALSEAIACLAEDPERRRAMGERSRALARERFDATVNYRRLVAALQEVAVT